MGVACFGPLDPHPASPTFGHILPTPKPGWTHADVVGSLRSALNIPVAFDTDVNGAALAEWRWGAGQGEDPVLYLTIGTGIGGGVIQQPQVLPLVRQKVQSFLKGYVQSIVLTQAIDKYIGLPGLDNRSGVLGAIALAEQTFLRS